MAELQSANSSSSALAAEILWMRSRKSSAASPLTAFATDQLSILQRRSFVVRLLLGTP